MKYGYKAGFRSNLLSEIKFAKKHFNFLEITLKPELLEYPSQSFLKIENNLKDFEVLGHIHWELKKSDKIYKNIKIFKGLGIKKITIHPFSNQSIKDNLITLIKINKFCIKNKLQLLVENMSSEPFNKVSNLAKLVDNIPDVGVTFDVGHANKTSRTEFSNFLKKFKSKIKHIHIHDNIGEYDHLFFRGRNKLKRIITKLNLINYNGTITLETFATVKGNRYISLDFPEIKKLHVKQLRIVKTLLES